MLTPIPEPAWAAPASNWGEILERYATFLQVPTWRASVAKDGKERQSCLSADEARQLHNQMLAALQRLLGSQASSTTPDIGHLEDLWRRAGRSTPRHERCPSKLQTHFQRSFLLNAAGYACAYCRRTAWDVYAAVPEEAQRRTLRFEVDHRITRRRLIDRNRFDPSNLVAACRSCNVIKAEMPEENFLRELTSLAQAVVSLDGRRV